MDREFESYNKNIDDFDARNIFEFDELKELNRMKFLSKVNEKLKNSENPIFLNKTKNQRFSIN